MGLRVRIDTDECVSAGKCVADHPAAFGFDDEELAVVLAGASQLSDEELLQGRPALSVRGHPAHRRLGRRGRDLAGHA